MGEFTQLAELELAVVIVDFGMGSKVMRVAKANGITFGLVVLGTGTLKNRVLEFLQLADIRKEVVVMASDRVVVSAAMEALNERFHFEKPFHGIAFTMPLHSLIGLGKLNFNHLNPGERKDCMYRAIITIVDRGMAGQVMDAATKAGARGGTILKARSAADAYDDHTLFHIDIEPEKEVVMILSEAGSADAIAAAIRDGLALEENKAGLVLCQDVGKTYGVS
ncbi:MAG: P-II family nitrogen regulator [Oscillospiraceae bacterium]|nr:P-II family nitrogen regulator [Oscillospiraceae bacterium]